MSEEKSTVIGAVPVASTPSDEHEDKAAMHTAVEEVGKAPAGLPDPGAFAAPSTTPAIHPGSQPKSLSNTEDDIDEIDEEWIAKAKAIIEKTKSDPFAESDEMSKVKADYLRIRYNKHLKTSNGPEE